MAAPRFALTLLLTVSATWAGCADHGDTDAPPEAPSNLEVSEAAGGGHLTWSDNSDDEEHFMVMRRVDGDGAFAAIASPTFDAEQYHDAAVTPGTAYVYKIIAMNGAGASESNEVSFTAP